MLKLLIFYHVSEGHLKLKLVLSGDVTFFNA